jgi:Transcriptional Coactivator p15 (PC4)
METHPPTPPVVPMETSSAQGTLPMESAIPGNIPMETHPPTSTVVPMETTQGTLPSAIPVIISTQPAPILPSSSAPPVITSKELGRFPLGNLRFAVICVLNGQIKLHIREYAEAGYPTKKGICLTPSRWASLIRAVPALDETIDTREGGDYRVHLGGFVYATAISEYGTVGIRQYFIPEGAIDEVPTKKGITLRRFEWYALKSYINDILRLSTELANARPCSDQLDHALLSGFLACCECNPSGDTIY